MLISALPQMEPTTLLIAFLSFLRLVTADHGLPRPVLNLAVSTPIERRGATVSWLNPNTYSFKPEVKAKWEGLVCSALDSIHCPSGVIRGSAHGHGQRALGEWKTHVTVRPHGNEKYEGYFMHVFEDGTHTTQVLQKPRIGRDGLTAYERLRNERFNDEEARKRRNAWLQRQFPLWREKLHREDSSTPQSGEKRKVEADLASSTPERGGKRRKGDKSVVGSPARDEIRESGEVGDGWSSLEEGEIREDLSSPKRGGSKRKMKTELASSTFSVTRNEGEKLVTSSLEGGKRQDKSSTSREFSGRW